MLQYHSLLMGDTRARFGSFNQAGDIGCTIAQKLPSQMRGAKPCNRHRERDVSEFPWTLPNRLRADALHRSVADWETLTAAATEIERLQRVIDSRPAINAALPESYVLWSQSIYVMESQHATKLQS
jgi:hypothetical protein